MNKELVAESARAARFEEASTQKDAQILMLKEHSTTWREFAEIPRKKKDNKEK